MRRPYKITILEAPSPERRKKLAKLTKTIRAGLYLRWTPFSGPKWGVAKVEPAELNTSWS